MNFTHWGNFFKPARNYFSEKLYNRERREGSERGQRGVREGSERGRAFLIY
jgi:hypothetical protein